MSNEPLGIYEELRRRTDYYESAKIRRRIAFPPSVNNGATAQAVNPFMRALRNRIRLVGEPRAEKYREHPQMRQRTLWPEAELGIALDVVIKAVIDNSEITAGEMFGPRQTRNISHPRQVAMYFADRYCPQYSLVQLGHIFSKDHTTIIAGINAVRFRLIEHDMRTGDLVRASHDALRTLAA